MLGLLTASIPSTLGKDCLIHHETGLGNKQLPMGVGEADKNIDLLTLSLDMDSSFPYQLLPYLGCLHTQLGIEEGREAGNTLCHAFNLR